MVNNSQRKPPRSCLVCSAPVVFAQLGMDVCRACCEFFKRVRTSGNEYPCRQGNGKCPTTQAKRSICRRCRFDKCVTVGLKYGGPVIQRKLPAPSILERIEHEWKSMRDRRREKELQMVRTSHARTRVYHPTEEIYDARLDCGYKIFNLLVSEAYIFYDTAFPALKEVPEREKEAIFTDFLGKFSTIDAYYRTKQTWGDLNKYMMCSVVTCYGANRWNSSAKGCDNDAQFMMSYARLFSSDQSELIRPVFNRLNIKEKEFYALIVLVLTELDSECTVSESALTILDQYRRESLEALQLYYQKELGLDNFSIRLGNLMSLNHAIQECKSLHKEFFRFHSTFFSSYVINEALKNLFL